MSALRAFFYLGLTRKKTSSEGGAIEFWCIAKSDRLIHLETEIQALLKKVMKLDPMKGGELAMSLISIPAIPTEFPD